MTDNMSLDIALTHDGTGRDLYDQNPWWRGERVFGVARKRRWAFFPTRKGLQDGLAPVTVLRGPRQVGKTTVLNQIIDDLLNSGIDPCRVFRVQFDDLNLLTKYDNPILVLFKWYEETIIKSSSQAFAKANNGPIYCLFDEVQNLKDWATQIKHLVDLAPVRAIVTGSSALRIEAGRDSLAGRLQTIEMGPLLLREIAELRDYGNIDGFLPFNGLAPLKEIDFWQTLRSFGAEHAVIRDMAFSAFSQKGSYPLAHVNKNAEWSEIASQLVETVVERAIQHDLRIGDRGRRRDETLLKEVFRLACRYLGQSPSQALYVNEIQQALRANVGAQTVSTYLKFLDSTLLLRLIDPLELRLKKKRGAPKVVLCDHALRAAWLQEFVPLDPNALKAADHLNDLAGRIAESVVGQFFKSMMKLGVAHFPEHKAEPEVDYVLTVGDQRIPIEVKYRRRITHADTYGLRSFIEKSVYNAPFGIIVTQSGNGNISDPRIVEISLPNLLLLR